MKDRLAVSRGLPWALALVLALLAAEGARADCFVPLASNDKWACTVELSTGELIPYCLNVTGTTGEGAARTFGMVTTGPYSRTCTCGVEGAGRKAAYNAGNSYLCFDESTDTAEAGTITQRKLVGQIYNVSANLRGTFRCAPDPACVVQP